jgi:NAD(P)-dependent dehydrogenase (short-subunit alcohol dehydrogenase family)
MSLEYNFRGKVIAITGGASGIGLATVKLLIQVGARVSIADLHRQHLDELVAEIKSSGGEALGFVVNVADASEVNRWIDQTVQQFGQLDGAANVAGTIGTGINKNRVEEIEDEDWALVLGVNLTGVMNCLRAEIQNIRHGGSIVNVTSIAGSIGIAKNAAYSAAKHGVVGLSRSAAKEVGDRHIRVNCVAP